MSSDEKCPWHTARAPLLSACNRHPFNLIELDHKVAELEAKEKKAESKVRADLRARIMQIHAWRSAFVNSYKALENEIAVTWEDTKAGLEKEWSELKALVESR